MSQSPLMEVKDLRVWYNSYRGYAKVLDGVDLHIHRGEKIGLVGEAGCGKTTTMKALMHLPPERTAKIPTGELFLEGQALNSMTEKERAALLRRHISMVFQEPASALNPVFTIGAHMVDVVRSAEAAKGVRLSKKEGLERAAEALAQVLIPDPARILTCYPNQLSGGMKQRVCIAMAVMAQRDLLIADEPGTALDVSIQAKVINMLMRFRREREMTYLFITHDLSLMRNIADRIVILYLGKVCEVADTRTFFTTPRHPYTQMLLSAIPVVSDLSSTPPTSRRRSWPSSWAARRRSSWETDERREQRWRVPLCCAAPTSWRRTEAFPIPGTCWWRAESSVPSPPAAVCPGTRPAMTAGASG